MKRKLDLQAKITLVLVGVILPTFVLVTLLENQFTTPVLVEEMRQIGITSAKTLSAEILSQNLLVGKGSAQAVESAIQEFLYLQPNVLRADVIVPGSMGNPFLLATNIEEAAPSPKGEDGEIVQVPSPPELKLVDHLETELQTDESGQGLWNIWLPIEARSRDGKSPRRNVGTIRVVVSTKLVTQIGQSLWKVTTAAAAVSFAILFLALTYFLRKTLRNERLLRRAETQNLHLTEKLHEVERQLMNTEKLAVMGQLTASFAHEIGTPLGSVGGHLQLLREEVGPGGFEDRFSVITTQLAKIETIVKNFLQSTSKPHSQRQLVDLNRIADQTLGIVHPRVAAMGVQIKRNYDRKLGPIRVVPVEMEQILLNLVNNSLDSLASKKHAGKSQIEVETGVRTEEARQWAFVSIYDTGVGIRREDLPNVLKPFFTTKGPGEGTGLGLTICRDIARKYGGDLAIDSREGHWARVTLQLPYPAEL